MDFVYPTAVFYTDKSNLPMYVMPVPFRFSSRFAHGYTRCSFSPATALSRWFLVPPAPSPLSFRISPAALPMSNWYKISPAALPMSSWCRMSPVPSLLSRWCRMSPVPSPLSRWCRMSPAALPMSRWCRMSPAALPMSRWYRVSPAALPMSRWCRIYPAPSPMLRWVQVSSAPVHCRDGQAVLDHNGCKYRHVTMLQSTFRHSRVFYGREFLSIVMKYDSVLFKYCVYSSCMFYDYTLYVFVNLCHLSMSVVEWCIQCRISRINSGSSKARYIVLQLSRNLYLRHDFRVLQMNFILKTRQQEDLQSILFLFILQVSRGASRWVFLNRAHSCRPSWIPKPSKPSYMPENLGPTTPQSNIPTVTVNKYSGDIGGRRIRAFTCHDLEPYLVTTPTVSSQESNTRFKFIDHVDNIGALEYPKERYVHAAVPLGILVSSLPLAHARKVVAMHGVTAGARSQLRELNDLVAGHSCSVCSTHTSIFLPNTHDAQMNTMVEFPPSPVDGELSHKIISSACKKMSRSSKGAQILKKGHRGRFFCFTKFYWTN